METIVDNRGQIMLDRELRDELGIGPGWRARQRRVGDRVEIEFLPPSEPRSLRGALADPNGPSFPTEDALHEATEEAWGLAMLEKYGPGSD